MGFVVTDLTDKINKAAAEVRYSIWVHVSEAVRYSN